MTKVAYKDDLLRKPYERIARDDINFNRTGEYVPRLTLSPSLFLSLLFFCFFIFFFLSKWISFLSINSKCRKL